MSEGTDPLLRIQVRAYRSEDPRLHAALCNLTPAMRRRRVLQLLRDALLMEEGLSVERGANTTQKPVATADSPPIPTADASKPSSRHNQAEFGPALSMAGLFSTPASMRSLNERQ